jgi:hypothetical protein
MVLKLPWDRRVIVLTALSASNYHSKSLPAKHKSALPAAWVQRAGGMARPRFTGPYVPGRFRADFPKQINQIRITSGFRR